LQKFLDWKTLLGRGHAVAMPLDSAPRVKGALQKPHHCQRPCRPRALLPGAHSPLHHSLSLHPSPPPAHSSQPCQPRCSLGPPWPPAKLTVNRAYRLLTPLRSAAVACSTSRALLLASLCAGEHVCNGRRDRAPQPAAVALAPPPARCATAAARSCGQTALAGRGPSWKSSRPRAGP
jgi:hypothetical protein